MTFFIFYLSSKSQIIVFGDFPEDSTCYKTIIDSRKPEPSMWERMVNDYNTSRLFIESIRTVYGTDFFNL